MTTEEIVALPAGPELDSLVFGRIYGAQGRRKKFSSSASAFDLLQKLPLVVGRARDGEDGRNPAKPFWAGAVEQHAEPRRGPYYATTMRIFAATPELALCKAALLHVAKLEGAAK